MLQSIGLCDCRPQIVFLNASSTMPSAAYKVDVVDDSSDQPTSKLSFHEAVGVRLRDIRMVSTLSVSEFRFRVWCLVTIVTRYLMILFSVASRDFTSPLAPPVAIVVTNAAYSAITVVTPPPESSMHGGTRLLRLL